MNKYQNMNTYIKILELIKFEPKAIESEDMINNNYYLLFTILPEVLNNLHIKKVPIHDTIKSFVIYCINCCDSFALNNMEPYLNNLDKYIGPYTMILSGSFLEYYGDSINGVNLYEKYKNMIFDYVVYNDSKYIEIFEKCKSNFLPDYLIFDLYRMLLDSYKSNLINMINNRITEK